MFGKQGLKLKIYLSDSQRHNFLYLICTARISCRGIPCTAPTSANIMRIFRFAGISGQMPFKFPLLTLVSELNGSRPTEENRVI